jgi:hypothetical protein
MLKLFFLSFAILSSLTCFAATRFVPVKMDAQNDYLRQGQVTMISEKNNHIALAQRDIVVRNGKAAFNMSCSNLEGSPTNLYFQNLSVTDQWGRPIRVVRREELIAKKRSQKGWAKFFSALGTGIEASSAERAGDITVQSNTCDVYNDSKGDRGSSASSTTETIRVEALRREALREVEIQGQIRSDMIESEYQNYKCAMQHNYFDSNTLLPQSVYNSVFQIDISPKIEKQLEHLFVNVDFGGERHTFCFYCTHR